MGFSITLTRHLLQYVHGRSGRSTPAANCFGRSGLAISGRAMVTASQEPEEMASRITDAVWNPPVHRTGIETARLISRASLNEIPSTFTSRTVRFHSARKIGRPSL